MNEDLSVAAVASPRIEIISFDYLGLTFQGFALNFPADYWQAVRHDSKIFVVATLLEVRIIDTANSVMFLNFRLVISTKRKI